MNIEELREYCLSIKEATEDMPFKEEYLIFRVFDKWFAVIRLDDPVLKITVKCDPALAVDLRERYASVEAAWHFNKKFWNSITLNSDMNDETVKYWIRHSVKEVVKKLPKKLQLMYDKSLLTEVSSHSKVYTQLKINPKMNIETERLLLRPITESDAEDIYEYSKGGNVGIHAGWEPHKSIEDTREIMKQVFLDQEFVFGVVLKETGKLFGSIGLIPDPKRQNDKTRMIGYAIGEGYWGKGYMTEAVLALLRFGFEELNLDLISAFCYPSNDRSKSVLKKCGFHYEGRLALAERRYDGEVLDNECYAILPHLL